jgi:hypothetical protein
MNILRFFPIVAAVTGAAAGLGYRQYYGVAALKASFFELALAVMLIGVATFVAMLLLQKWLWPAKAVKPTCSSAPPPR